MISERLRSETAGHHESIEQAKRFSRLGNDDFTLPEYVEILERFYGFYQPLEVAFCRHADVIDALQYEARFKLPLLKKDLIHLGHTEESIARLPICSDMPATDSKAHVLGCMYVMEGSTHGSQFIAKRLRERFNLQDGGLAFYEGYGQNTMPQWKAFKAYLDSEVSQGQDGDAVVMAAAQTFESLQCWMDQ